MLIFLHNMFKLYSYQCFTHIKKKCKDYLKADVSTLIIYLQMSKCILARATSENEVYLGGWCL